MPKMKTKSGAAKRFQVRGSGSIKRYQAVKRHILTKKYHQEQAPAARHHRGPATNLGHVQARCFPTPKERDHASRQTWSNGARAPQEGPRPGQGFPRPPRQRLPRSPRKR